LSASKKNLYIVNFWATWCAPCIKEIPDLILLKEKIGEDIDVFFISIDSNPLESIPNFLKKNKIDFPHFYTDKKMKISRDLDVKVMPTTLIINKEIKEISRVIGYIDWKNEEIINLIKKLI
jgi:thiol-disulfide isomerase/thioredoxin